MYWIYIVWYISQKKHLMKSVFPILTYSDYCLLKIFWLGINIEKPTSSSKGLNGHDLQHSRAYQQPELQDPNGGLIKQAFILQRDLREGTSHSYTGLPWCHQKKKFKTTNPKYRNSIVHTFYTEKMQSKVIKVLLPQEEQNEPKFKKHKIKKKQPS